MNGPELARADIHALLRSLLRTRRLAQGQAQYLLDKDGESIRDWAACGDSFAAARDLTDMLHLEPELANIAGLTEEGWAGDILAAWLASSRTVVFRTSGSTGEAVPCPQAGELLVQDARGLAEVFQGRSRVVTLVPLHHVYGFFFSILLPKGLGAPMLEMPPVPSDSLLAALRPGDLLVAFPLFWKALADHGLRLPEGVHGVTSTGPCPPEVIHALLAQGLERMSEVYGSSETGGLGIRHAPEDPYTLFPFWTPYPEDDPQPANLTRTLDSGEVLGPIVLPDLVHWENRRQFRPLRRTDKAVQVGGVNVYPERVAAVMAGHPMVRECAVRLMRPEEGVRLKAFVVPVDGAQENDIRRELKTWMAARLGSAEIPKSLTFGTALPINAMGKAADWNAWQRADKDIFGK